MVVCMCPSGARASVLTVLDDDGLRTCAAGLASDAERELAAGEVDALVVDLGMPGMDAVQFVQRVAKRFPSLAILALAPQNESERVLAAVRAGVHGCLYLEDVASRLARAVREALAGGRPISRGMELLFFESVRRSGRPPSQQRRAARALTERERAVLEYMARGLSYEEVGRALAISLNTVRTYVRVIYEKLDVSSRTEAVLVAIRLGLLKRTPYPGTPRE